MNLGGKKMEPNNSQMRWYDYLILGVLIVSVGIGLTVNPWFLIAMPVYIVLTPIMNWLVNR